MKTVLSSGNLGALGRRFLGDGNESYAATLIEKVFGKGHGDLLLEHFLRTGSNPDDLVMDPGADNVREGPFCLVTEYADNSTGAQGSLLSTIVDPGLLRGGASGDDAVKNQLLIITGYKIELDHYGTDIAARNSTLVAQMLSSIGLYVKTATGTNRTYERWPSGAAATGTVIEAGAVGEATTAAATTVSTQAGFKKAEFRSCRPFPVYMNGDTFKLYQGAAVNIAGNLKVLVTVQGWAINWEVSGVRPGMEPCGDGILGRLFMLRQRYRRTGGGDVLKLI